MPCYQCGGDPSGWGDIELGHIARRQVQQFGLERAAELAVEGASIAGVVAARTHCWR